MSNVFRKNKELLKIKNTERCHIYFYIQLYLKICKYAHLNLKFVEENVITLYYIVIYCLP